jgi:glycosyltransferase involved in cell wall biosynthesis
MKILYFHQHFTTPKGSTGTRSYELARHLVSNGHEVTIICGAHASADSGLTGPFKRGRRDGTVDGLRIIEFDLAYSNHDGFVRRSVTFLKFALRSMWVATTADADLVFATSTPLTAALPGIAAKLLRRRTFVFEVRDLWPELPKAMGAITNPFVLGLMGMLEWLGYHTADRLVGLSPGICEGIAKRGIPTDRIMMISNGCDRTMFADPAATPWRPEGIEASDFLAIFTGTHGAANGLDAVVDAAIELKRRNSRGLKILLVGDGREKPALRARAEAEGVGHIICFHPPVPKTKLVGLMQSADMGLQILRNVPAFYYGTSPNKFFDYLAAELPVLTNYPGWVANLVREHKAGIAVPPDDPAAFADALQVAQSPRDREALGGKNAAALAAKEFDRETLAARWTEWICYGKRVSTGVTPVLQEAIS